MLIDGQYIQSSPGTTYNTDYFPNRLTLSYSDKEGCLQSVMTFTFVGDLLTLSVRQPNRTWP